MRLRREALFLLAVAFVLHCEYGACYKTEVEITPAPPEDATTKKSGFFSGFKNLFRGSSTTTTTPTPPVINVAPTPKVSAGGAHMEPPKAAKPPPLNVNMSPLQPLGPRPDTPSTSPFGGGNPHQPPQWPQPGQTSTSAGNGPIGGNAVAGQQLPHSQQQPQQSHLPGGRPISAGGGQQLPGQPQQSQHSYSQQSQHGQQQRPGVTPSTFPGFSPYQPPRNQPSGVDLSYGGGFGTGGKSGGQQPGGRPGFGLSPMPSTSGSTPPPAATPAAPLRPGQPHPSSVTPAASLHPGQPQPVPGSPTVPQRSGQTPPPPPPPPKTLDFDMRFGGGAAGTSAITTPKSAVNGVKEDFPALPSPRRPSSPGVGGVKEEFPSLPAPKSPSPTPAAPNRPSSPSAWNSPLPTPVSPPGTSSFAQKTGSPTPPPSSASTAPSASGGNGVSFVPHAPTATGGSTVRPASALAADEEIRTLTETLYTKEVNNQLNFIQISPQGKTRSIDSTDEAPKPLLNVDAKALEAPTIAKMQLLFNNYEEDTSVNEHVTAMEHKEENDFLDAVMSTAVMRQAMVFLQNKNLVGPDPKTHRDMVKELWFTQYSRGGGRIGSSGFEHVFVNEVKNGTIIGLHNWVYFNEEEKAGRLDYKGYLNQLDLGTKAKVMKVRFTHNGLNKPVNTLFIGTSPELELALYTVCFKLRPDSTCPVSLGNSKFGIVTYSWRYRGKSLIGSAYPEI